MHMYTSLYGVLYYGLSSTEVLIEQEIKYPFLIKDLKKNFTI